MSLGGSLNGLLGITAVIALNPVLFLRNCPLPMAKAATIAPAFSAHANRAADNRR
jgi:hypothetical protein